MISSNAITAAPDLGDKPLADDPAERVGQTRAELFLFFGFEHAQDAVDGLPGIHRVQRAQHKVARLGGAQGDLDGLAVTHLADQDHFGGLAEGRPQAVGEAIEVGAQFALIESGQIMLDEQTQSGLPA